MDLKEAYSVLGLADGSSKEDAKKAFRKLAAKHHPDNKATGNADLFKKINEANQVIETGKDYGPTNHSAPSRNNYGGGQSIDIEDLIRQATGGGASPFNRQRRRNYIAENKMMSTNITFRESVIGCQKELTYKRKLKCDICNGNGLRPIHNGCTVCGGTGMRTQKHGNVIMQSTCNSCGGMQRMEPCLSCKEEGANETETTITVNIPGGIKDGRNILRLEGIGDYAGSMFGSDQYTNVILTVGVEKNMSLKIEDNDVITHCNVSLLEAIKGCSKSVDSIDGLKEIQVLPLTKNSDEILIPKLGVNRIGNERVIVSVNYPTNLDSIIEVLEKNKES